MKPLFTLSLIVALPLGAQAKGTVSQLKWMAGCWEQHTGPRIAHEQWMSPLGEQMMGMSRTVMRDTVREFEQLRIEMRNGAPTYVALPSGQTEASFAATTVSDTLVVFSNPTHDFPQRIIYRRVRNDSLLARIEGQRNGATRGVDFPMKRAPCGG